MKYLSLILLSFSSFSYALTWESGTTKANLVELYTSESCSSCPPAEKWMNKIKSDSVLYKDVVPVEYHVDYWNYLHWNDKHSDNKYTQRQRRFAQKRGTSVFTPQILINGKKDVRAGAKYPKSSKSKAPNLSIKADIKTGVVTVKTDYKKNFICEAAVTKGGFVSKVKSGENSGRTLRHEFVVKELYSSRPSQRSCSFKMSQLKSENDRGLAVWIRSPETFEVIQATGRYLVEN